MVTMLAPSHCHVTGFYFENINEFTFVLLTDVPKGTEIEFTQHEIGSDESFRGGKKGFTWRANRNYNAEEIVTLTPRRRC